MSSVCSTHAEYGTCIKNFSCKNRDMPKGRWGQPSNDFNIICTLAKHTKIIVMMPDSLQLLGLWMDKAPHSWQRIPHKNMTRLMVLHTGLYDNNKSHSINAIRSTHWGGVLPALYDAMAITKLHLRCLSAAKLHEGSHCLQRTRK
jgi:hypothetical protein